VLTPCDATDHLQLRCLTTRFLRINLRSNAAGCIDKYIALPEQGPLRVPLGILFQPRFKIQI